MSVRFLAKHMTITILLFLLVAGMAVGKGKQESSFLINVEDVERIFEEGNTLILDVRDEHSYVDGHLPGAILLPLPLVEQAAGEILSLNASVITYCSCPAEESSLAAALKLKGAGVQNVYVLVGGYEKWVQQQRPVVSGPNPL